MIGAKFAAGFIARRGKSKPADMKNSFGLTERNQLAAAMKRHWLDWLIVLLLAVAFWHGTPKPVLLTCLGAILIAVEINNFILWRFREDAKREEKNLVWLRLIQVGAFLYGSVWGIASVVLFHFSDLQTEPVLLIGLMAIVGIWCLSHAASSFLIHLFALPASLPLLTVMTIQGSNTKLLIVAIAVIFLGYGIRLLRMVDSNYRNTLMTSARRKAESGLSSELQTLLEQDRARLQSLLDAVPIPIVVSKRSTGELLYMNKSTVKVMGLQEAVRPGTKTTDFFKRPEERERLAQQLADKGGIADFEINLRRADGSDFWVLYSASQMIYDGTSSIIGVFVDITARRKADEALRESEEKFRLFADHAHDIILMYDMKGICRYVSPSVQSRLGYSPDAVTGKKIQEFVHPDDLSELIDEERNNLKSRPANYTHLYRVQHADGHWVWTETTSSPERDPDTGRVKHIFAVSRDVTDRILYEEELKDARERAESADRAKSEFLAHMSHEIRTPLNAVIGFSEVMRDELFGKLGSPRYAEYIQDIHNSGTHLLALINDVLDLSKIEAGKFELLEDKVAINDIAETVCRIISERAKAKQISIITHLPDEVYLWCDRRAITQVLINILGNAVKFTPEGGEIQFDCEIAANGDLIIRVTDNGIGIAQEDLPRVLEPFVQSRGSVGVAANETGTGLGLALSNSLLQKHQGTLELSSKLNIGTCLTLTLPAARVIEVNSVSEGNHDLQHGNNIASLR